ncbi:septum formation initiator family protein [Pseudonocardiaceae bacterium YIM PH 21723]|nr:septum formation initiator family protein [Pseudonocardiaceae bacterium YIM PH 21723]
MGPRNDPRSSRRAAGSAARRRGAASSAGGPAATGSVRRRPAAEQIEPETPAAPRLRKTRDTGQKSAGSGGAFGLSSTRRAALLALVCCALALTVAVPLRTYLTQRHDIAAAQQRNEQLAAQTKDLQEQKEKLDDPAQAESEIRKRLRMVKPGETPYRVQLPGDAPPPKAPEPEQKKQDKPWYDRLWDSIAGSEK